MVLKDAVKSFTFDGKVDGVNDLFEVLKHRKSDSSTPNLGDPKFDETRGPKDDLYCPKLTPFSSLKMLK